MPIIYPQPATGPAAVAGPGSVTRQGLRRHVAGSWGLGGLFVGVAHDGQTILQGQTLLVDQSADGLLDTAYDSDRFEHGWLRKINPDFTQETHRISSYSPSDGTIGIGRPFLSTPVTDVTAYEVHTHGVSPDDLDAAIAWACQLGRQSTWVMLGGLLPDGDMQDSGVGHWLGVGGATDKVPKPGGGLMLRSAATYARSDAMACTPGKVVRAYADGPGTIVIWDDTHGVALGTGTGSVTALVPSGTSALRVRLMGAGDWTGAAVYESGATGMELPEWCLPHDQSIVNIAYAEGFGNARKHWTLPGLPEPRGAWLEIEPGEWPGPIMMQCAVPFVVPLDDTHEFPAGARDYLATGALRHVYTALARPKTIDTARFEAQRVRLERDWQAYQRSRNPIAMRRYSWGRR